MNGHKGRTVRLRYMLHHDHEIEVFDAASGEYLGSAELQGQADDATIAQTHAVRADNQRQLERDLKLAARKRTQRYAPVATPQPAQVLGTLTSEEADQELSQARIRRPRPSRRPALMPLPDPDPGWVRPGQPVSAQASALPRDQRRPTDPSTGTLRR
ncbi:putative transposase [Nonomuraea soli]|uniref:Putative transposase n=2 Tax=Nonomuraea soli TaxID=1032476 RepID=A0A7W0CHF1_9ACTN|nr:putative transposase [Nonomuraea soli]